MNSSEYTGAKTAQAKSRTKNMLDAAKKARNIIRNRLMQINKGLALLKEGAKLEQSMIDSLEKLLQRTLALARKHRLHITLDTSSGWPMRYLRN